jgi:putative endonuclease
MKYFVYILKSLKDNKRYVGFTSNIDLRINEHNSGNVRSTKDRRPLELIYFEAFTSKKEAMQREKFFKTGKGREYLNSIGKK